MKTAYKYKKNRLILLIIIPLFIFLSSVANYIYDKERLHIFEGENQKLQTEVELLGGFLSDSILKKDYAEAKNFLNSWLKQKSDVRHLTVEFSNGKKLFEYDKKCKYKLTKKKEFIVSNKKYTIYLAHSIEGFQTHIEELKYILMFLVLLLTAIVGLSLWFVLTSWIVKPLEEEINDKTADLNNQKTLLEKINTSYKSLSQSNLALLEAKNEQELLDSVCKIVHNYCSYKLVWIGYKNNDGAKTITVHSSAGINNGYIKDLNVFWSDAPRGDGPTGRSIRFKKTIVINDTANDKTFKPWRDNAIKRGFLSAASLPIIYNDVVIGCMAIYADKKDAFFDEEIKLLNKLVSNLAFGIISLRQRKEIEKSSITDGLTNIYNRRYFDKIFPEFVQLAKRTNDLVCFIMLDIDHFKQYNDIYGHQKGDDVLISVATSISNSLNRPDDKCFRLGGEEFGILFKSTSKEKAMKFANSIKNNIENLKIEHSNNSASDYITASLGLVCQNAKEIISVDVLYKQADDLLYTSKENGRNQVTLL
ncbi:sensor domain-containing diguanylate cyclase [Arcobacteraceae bacterium]|nr:sensor domain-containing diguanylate cyclase [Arcobacteraceae bacterium]